MCTIDYRPLTFETVLTDPLIRLVMASDGVSPAEHAAVLTLAGAARAARGDCPCRYALPYVSKYDLNGAEVRPQ